MRQHETHEIDWCNMHEENGSGFNGYFQSLLNTAISGSRREGIALHPGSISHGCITVKTAEWSKVRDVITQEGTISYAGANGKTQSFIGMIKCID